MRLFHAANRMRGKGTRYEIEPLRRLRGRPRLPDLPGAARPIRNVAALLAQPLLRHRARGVLNVFSPANYPEFHRALGQGGFLIKAVPTAKHFHEIREQIGASAPERKDYSNERVLRHFSESCTMREHRTVTSTIHPTPAQLSAAVEMTPIMFGMDRASVNWASIDTLTMEAELLVGTFD